MKQKQRDYGKLLRLKNLVTELESLRPQIDYGVNCAGTIHHIIQYFINELKVMGFNLKELPLAHDLGHVVYDTKSAILLMNDPKIGKYVAPPDFIAGIIGGIFHDSGLLLANKPEFCQKMFGFRAVSRFEEAEKLLRHAESGAILAEKLLSNIELDTDPITQEYIKKMIVYVIAAHTNYKQQVVQGYTIQPYKDAWSDELPIYPVTIARWCDRMDLVGPHYILRHFCTLAPEIHTHLTIKDGKQQFREISLESSMDLSLDGNMRDHVLMYKNSQSNDSPYGKYDLPGIMIDYREYQKQRTQECLNILDQTGEPEEAMTRKELFQLIKEASMCNEDENIDHLVTKFFNIPDKNRIPWLRAFAKAKELMDNPEFPGEGHALALAKKLLVR
ncbi:MAG TPA: hypothetical protein PLD95_02440 [bacterium]|jgi:hypothetical protein|nr:hypothetical protein [bacterium]HOG38309.1 hypothetical protein [bacterium]HQI03272.1 hypothetical protein [bacterium]